MEKEICNLMLELAKIDYQEPLPELNQQFLQVWGKHYSRILHLVPKERERGKVLEVGVGYGVLAVMLRRLFHCDLVATEHPSRGYIYAEEFRNFMDHEGVTIVPHDLAEPFSFSDMTFDMVLYCDVIEHLPTEIISYSLREIKRVLKREGTLILSTPNLSRLSNRIKFLQGRGINPPILPRKIGETYDHIREFTLDEIETVLSGDYRIIRREYGLIPFFNKSYNAMNCLLFHLFHSLGDELYILARARKNGV